MIFQKNVRKKLQDAIDKTKNNNRTTLILGFELLVVNGKL